MELKLNPANPRTIGKKEFERLKNSIRDFPKMLELRPVIYDDTLTILGGNMRYRALKELEKEGFELKDTYFKNAKELTPEETRKFVIKDNISDGAWDDDVLANEWSDLPLDEWGVDTSGWKSDEVVEDEAPEVSQEPAISRLGEVYQLGRHRLLCGDSTKIEDVENLMNGQKADMVFTDPPYGMKKENEGVLNDNLNYDDLLDFNKEWITLTFAMLKDNGSWYCWGTDEPLMDIYSNVLKTYIKENKATFRNLITWDKGNGQGQNSEEYRMYAIADEKCLFVMAGVQGFSTNQDNYYEAWEPVRLYLASEKEKMGWSDKYIAEQLGIDPRLHWFGKSQWEIPTEDKYKELQKLSGYNAFKKDYNEIKKDYYATRAYFDNTHDNMNNVWHISRDVQNQDHATPKPLELCQRAIKSSSRESETVLDLFGGSGSTLIACEQLNRTCYMMELDPKYCDVIRKRYAKFIGREEEWETITPKI